MARMGKYLSLCLVVILALSSLFFVLVVRADTESIQTSCSISVDKTIEGQPIVVTIQMFPTPPSGEVFSNISVGIFSPQQGISGNGPWDQKNISTDSNGKVKVTFNIPTFSSATNWEVWVYFGGQHLANNTLYYQSGHWESKFFVYAAQTPTPSPTANPSALSPTPNPTPTPSVPEFPITVLLVTILAALSLLLIISKKKLTTVNH